MTNILVTGANGQLGSEIQALVSIYPQYQFTFTDVSDLDITNHKAVHSFMEVHRFDVIINCAAYTAVDKAETEVEINEALNHLAVKNLATIAKEQSIKLVQVSTDYVFDGTKDTPYTETDVPNPQSVYGLTKLKGEKAIQEINPVNSIIIRTSWVYSSYGNNFVKTMLRLGKDKKEINVVSDQMGSPTFAGDLAKAILEILPKIKNDKVELYHYANAGTCSWYDFAKTVFKFKGMKVKVNPITSDQYQTPAKRPMFSVLGTEKIKERFKMVAPDWEKALEDCLMKL